MVKRIPESQIHLPQLDALWNRITLIIGEVGSGKTYHTEQILKKMIDLGEDSISVIDMTPEAHGKVGGKMDISGLEGVVYYTDYITAPRLTGKTSEEIFKLALENARRIERLFEKYRQSPSRVLIINDVSIYLQTGDLDRLWEVITITPTVVMNGYYGRLLGHGQLSKREGERMETLSQRCDIIICLEPYQ